LKVLFVFSENSKAGANYLIRSQGASLKRAGLEVNYYPIRGKGFRGYLNNVLPLRNYVKSQYFDIIHAHYSLSAIIATLSGCRPLVVSLMGSDIRLGFLMKHVVKLFSWLFWKEIIVKAPDMIDYIWTKKFRIIPNGVNTSLFVPSDKQSAINSLGWNNKKNHLLFAANPLRPVKNFSLMKKAFKLLENKENIDLHILLDITHNDVPQYINASDVVVLTSLWEGSPNVIKEAMACNCPIVSTDVGDVKWVFGNTDGCYITSFEPEDVAQKIELALEFASKHGRTQGRKRIIK